MDRTFHPRTRRIAPLVATAAASVLRRRLSQQFRRKKKAEESGAAVSAGKADTPRMTVALVTHQAPGDTFWDIVRKGAEAAAAKDNVKLVYSADPNAGNQANLVQERHRPEGRRHRDHPGQAGRHEGRREQGDVGRVPWSASTRASATGRSSV